MIGINKNLLMTEKTKQATIVADNKVLLWTVNDKKWLLNYNELTNAFLDNKHPFTGKTLSTVAVNKINKMFTNLIGSWWVPKIKAIRDYKELDLPKLRTLKKTGVKLGDGKYATVYLYQGYAIKVINHKFYKGLPRIDGAFEADILQLIQRNIVYNYYTPNIITFYQYLPDKKTDYIILERLNMTFWDYLQGDPKDHVIKAIIVQILFTLIILQKVLPGFRHNDLKVDNILLDFTPRKEDTVLRFRKRYWHIPMSAPLVKIADFDYAYIPNVAVNCKVGTEHSASFGCTASTSKIYDLHLFLNSLYSYRNNYSKDIVTWLQQQLPAGTRGNENKHVKFGRLKNPQEMNGNIKTPLVLLSSAWFADFKITDPTELTGPTWGFY